MHPMPGRTPAALSTCNGHLGKRQHPRHAKHVRFNCARKSSTYSLRSTPICTHHGLQGMRLKLLIPTQHRPGVPAATSCASNRTRPAAISWGCQTPSLLLSAPLQSQLQLSLLLLALLIALLGMYDTVIVHCQHPLRQACCQSCSQLRCYSIPPTQKSTVCRIGAALSTQAGKPVALGSQAYALGSHNLTHIAVYP